MNIKNDEIFRLIEELREDVYCLIFNFPDESFPYLRSMIDMLSRLERKLLYGEFDGEKILKLKYGKLLANLKKRYPKLYELSFIYLAIIAEVYNKELVDETFSLLEMIEEDLIDETIHILGEMAIMRNNPYVYLELINLLKKSDYGKRKRILLDDRVNFKTDDIIESALKDYLDTK